MVKKAARQLLDGENIFTTEFNHNKGMLGTSMPSKPIRNKIAGYISRLKKPKREIKPKEKVFEQRYSYQR